MVPFLWTFVHFRGNVQKCTPTLFAVGLWRFCWRFGKQSTPSSLRWFFWMVEPTMVNHYWTHHLGSRVVISPTTLSKSKEKDPGTFFGGFEGPPPVPTRRWLQVSTMAFDDAEVRRRSCMVTLAKTNKKLPCGSYSWKKDRIAVSLWFVWVCFGSRKIHSIINVFFFWM